MKINFKIEGNKEYNSTVTMTLSNIKLGDSTIISGVNYYLTEKDLTNLVRELYNKRPDVFEEEGFVKPSENEITELEDLRENIKYLESQNEELQNENNDLQDELDALQNGEIEVD